MKKLLVWKKNQHQYKMKLLYESLQEFRSSRMNEESSTVEKLLNTAMKDNYITKSEATAQYIMSAANEIAKKWDALHPEEKKVYRDNYYKEFLRKIKKA